MKKIVRNNQTFIVNEELYKKIKKHSYLFEEEQTGSLFPDMDNKEKNKESESHKLANEVRRAELLNDARVEARILELYRKQYIRILSLSGEIEQAIQKNEGLSDFFKNIDMKKFIKIVVKSKALFTEFKRQYFRLNFVDKKITPAWNVFCKVFMSFIRSKRFREGTLKKTYQSYIEDLPLFKQNHSSLTKQNGNTEMKQNISAAQNNVDSHPMGESYLHEDINNINPNKPPYNIQKAENDYEKVTDEIEQTLANFQENTLKDDETKFINDVEDNLINSDDKSSKDTAVEKLINESSDEEIIELLDSLTPINPVDYAGILALKTKISSTEKNEEGVSRYVNPEDIKLIVTNYLKSRNEAIIYIKNNKDKINVNTCISLLKNPNLIDKIKENNPEKLSFDNIKKILESVNEKPKNIKNENEDSVAALLTNSLIYFRNVEISQRKNIVGALNTKLEKIMDSFNYYSYKKMLNEANVARNFNPAITSGNLIFDIIKNERIGLYGIVSVLDVCVNNTIIRIFNTPELSSLSKKIKQNINKVINSEKNKEVHNEYNMEDKIKKALKYIGGDKSKLSIKHYDEMFGYALKVNESINEIITKANNELNKELTLFDPLHYKLISGDIFGTIKKVCENDNVKLDSLRELYGFSILTNTCNEYAEKITDEGSYVKLLKSGDEELSELMTELAERCKKHPLSNEKEDLKSDSERMTDYYKNSLFRENDDKLISDQLITSLVRIITVHNEKQQLTVINAIRQNNEIKDGYDVTQGYMIGFLGQPLLTLTFTKDDKYYGTLVFMHTFGTFNKLFGAWANKSSITNSFKRLLRM